MAKKRKQTSSSGRRTLPPTKKKSPTSAGAAREYNGSNETQMNNNKVLEFSFSSPTTPVAEASSVSSSSTTRKPYQLRFPPTIFTNVIYSQGIQLAEPVEILPHDDHHDSAAAAATITARVREDYYYKSRSDLTTSQQKRIASFLPLNPRSSPILTPSEALLWGTKKAAESMTKSYFPVQTGRLLGTITRHVRISVKQQLQPQQQQQQQQQQPATATVNHSGDNVDIVNPPFVVGTFSIARINPKLKGTKLYPLSAAQAKKEALLLLLHSSEDSSTAATKNNTATTTTRSQFIAQQLQDTWMDRVLVPGQQSPTWHSVHGYLLPEAVNDPSYVPLPLLEKWLTYYDWTQVVAVGDSTTRNAEQQQQQQDDNNKNDLESIFHALGELSTPHIVSYDLPMIICYPTVRPLYKEGVDMNDDSSDNNNNNNNNNSTLGRPAKRRKLEQDVNNNDIWEIQMAVYAHRSLPLILTESSVKTVMSALDIGSFRITEPLHLPPRPPQPTFGSCKFPVVTFDDENDHEEHDDDANANDEKGENIKDEQVVDLTLQGTTRDENTLSAFSTAGFMKLLENTGTDTSNWPEIATKLQSSLTLELMLHQQHAVCWMVQMEELEGFGINSILWEEREYLDGGKFYYSPALGQIQLNRPANMKGGIACC